MADWVKEASKILSNLHYGKKNVELFLYGLGHLHVLDDVMDSSNPVAYSNAIHAWINSTPEGVTRDKSKLVEELRSLDWNLAAIQINAIEIPSPSVPSTSQNPITSNNVKIAEILPRQIQNVEAFESSHENESSSTSRHNKNMDTTDAQIQRTEERIQLKKYETKCETKARVLILNFITFTMEKVSERIGAEKDGKNLRGMFEDFGFDVTYKKNATLNDLFDPRFGIVQEFIKSFDRYPTASETPSCFIVISTHGIKDGFLAAKDHFFSFEMITRQLTHVNAPKLKGVPKVILLNACRGDIILEQTFKIESDGPRGEEKVVFDLLISFSTAEDFVSSRHIEDGSIFIQKFVKAASELYKHMDIEEILKYVTTEIYKMCSSEKIAIQIPETRNHGFHYRYFFNKD